MARAVADRFQHLGMRREAGELLAAASKRLRGAAVRSEMAAAADKLVLDAGGVPSRLTETVGLLTAQADAALKSGRPGVAASFMAGAFQLAFHRTVHFDGTSSPLAEDTDAFLSPLRRSSTYQHLQRGAGRAKDPVHPAGRPHRLLFVSYKNWKFAEPLIEHYAAMPGVETRRFDLADVAPGVLPLSPTQQTRLRVTMDDASSAPWAEHVLEHLTWADTVFVEWSQRAAVLVSCLDPGERRVIVRLHSFEAFTAFPHLIDWSRVDDLVFVAPHVRDFVRAVDPRIDEGPRLAVIPNAVSLTPYLHPKSPDARFTLGLLGYAAVAKDALWAVEVLGILRAHDDRYRLMLVGHDLPASGGPSGAADYRALLEQRIARPDVAGAVERVAFTPDVPAVLREVGVIISSSVRESFHLGLVEGAASGAVPVVRDWPMFARYGGPRSLFPPEWIVGTPAEAAERIRIVTATDDAWRAEGMAASETARTTYDWSVVARRFDDFLLSSDPPASRLQRN